ncbi:hypothetical protein K431DRAFT_283517 [Polychaeton citri CBS 116435]|uniref:Pentatricopeptide repeat-containing protein-mitochondrial domain-containing protein n=1 Tax=Polychaeton citri CBS 116435 TaxID=1314669 RepID=A0A9P4UP30_9PEZI|nr:hypothetical protein K431DRAFT_283517 [Polychaeton citri CBS 116435]
MTTVRLATDPLWQALCPHWNGSIFLRAALRPSQAKKVAQRSQAPHPRSRPSPWRSFTTFPHRAVANRGFLPQVQPVDFNEDGTLNHPLPADRNRPDDGDAWLAQASTEEIVQRLRRSALKGDCAYVRRLAVYLVGERGMRPSISLYNAIILSNTSHSEGSAGRVADLLEEMRQNNIAPDVATCHAVLKVLSVHVDHLLRDGVLRFMHERWYQPSDEGMHDVAAGQLREGLFEQALDRLDAMRRQGVAVQPWLLDLFVYTLCEADEIDTAHDIMRTRFESGELNLSRTLWMQLLDFAADARHYTTVALIWNSQVQPGYLNPSSGMCLNILTAAAKVGDAVLATDVFAYLSKRGITYQPIHYELLISTYLSSETPDLQRALSILTIMPVEKLEPSEIETRTLFTYLNQNPAILTNALSILRELHTQGRVIPIAALNLLIECYVEQHDLAGALKVYKQIHTFTPVSEHSRRSFANTHTFDLLLKGCRTNQPPDSEQASFLVSELLALQIKPTALTYDRLILVFVEAAKHWLETPRLSFSTEEHVLCAKDLLSRAHHHFTEMHEVGWMPRRRTIEALARRLAELHDPRCWDMLQIAGDNIDDWQTTGQWARRHCEEAWAKSE